MIEEQERLSDLRQERYDDVGRVLGRVLIANLLVTLLKITVGLLTGVLAIVADGFQSLVNASSNLNGRAAIRLARRPADEKHPYGYQRYETAGAFIFGVFMLLAAWEIAREIIIRLRDGSQVEVSFAALMLMLGTVGVNLTGVVLEKRAGQRLTSAVLLADARHAKTNLYITGSVVLSLIGMWLGWLWLDSIVAAIVVALIVKSALKIIRDTSHLLVEKSLIDIEEIAEIAYSVPQVCYVDNIRSGGTPDFAFVDLHLKVSGVMGITLAHEIASEVENRVTREIEAVKDTLVHIEPAKIDRPARWESIYFNLRNLAEGMGLGLHDFHVHAGHENEDYTVELHLEFESGITLGEAHKKADLFEAEALRRWSQVDEVITHLEPLPQRVLPPGARADPGVEARVVSVLDDILHTGQLRSLQLYHTGGHLHAVIVICLDENIRLTEAQEFSEKIETELRKQVSSLNRVTLHVEPYRTKVSV